MIKRKSIDKEAHEIIHDMEILVQKSYEVIHPTMESFARLVNRVEELEDIVKKIQEEREIFDAF